MRKEKMYIIDGTSLCYRAFFALKLSNSKGFPTGAVYGFYQTLKKLISQYSPKYLGVCFDLSRKTFRTEILKEYKIQRPPLPDGLKGQIPIVKRLINLLGITLIEKENFEADDLIASLTEEALANNLDAVIVSSDKDLFQLLSGDKVVTYNPNQERIFNESDFLKEYHFPPRQIVDYLSLAGDSSDNIPGAKGIGKVGASRLVAEFGEIENIFNNLDKLPPKTKEILSKNRESVFLSKELAKLKPPALKISCQDLKIKDPQYREIYRLFQELEFKKLLKDLPSSASGLKIKIKEGRLKDLMKEPGEELALFIEQNDCYLFEPKKECINKFFTKDLKFLFEDQRVKKISHGFKEQIFRLKGIALKNIYFDLKVAAYLLNPSLSDYSLPSLSSGYLGDFLTEIPPRISPYFIYRLYQVLSPKLREEKLDRLFFDVEMPLVSVLAQMQCSGIKIEKEVIGELLGRVEKEAEEISKNIFKLAGKEFNLNSPKQLGGVLFKDLKIPPLKKTKTGYSTGEDVLEKLADKFPIAKHLLAYRQLNKLKTTYILPLLEDLEGKGCKLHATFNQTSTQTGRISCSAPNLQSIPAKGKFASQLRGAFVSSFPRGYLLSGDYSQIELRILAHFSRDQRLCEAFTKDLDIHTFTASLLLGAGEKEVSASQRDLAKRVNFSILYGMGAYGLAQELKITVAEAESFIENYFLRYPKVREYIEKVYREVERTGFVRTILGRRRSLPDFNSSNPHLKDFARRQAINTPIQGSCADLIKLAMVRISCQLRERKLKAQLIIQIHDELIFDLPSDELKEVLGIVRKNMEKSIELSVPIKVNLKAGRNWAQMESVE